MRYEWGLGVGHTYSHQDATTANLEALCAWIPPAPDASVTTPVGGDLGDLPPPVESADEQGNGPGARVQVGDSGVDDHANTNVSTNDDSIKDSDSINTFAALALAAADDDDDDNSDEDGTSEDSDEDDDPHQDFDSEDEKEIILFGCEC